MKKKLVVIGAVALAGVAIGGFFLLAKKAESAPVGLYGGVITNEYGCRSNCTGEYQIRHVKRILEENPSKNYSENVRFLVKVSKNARSTQWLQDIDDPSEYKVAADVNAEAQRDHLMCFSGIESGFTNYKPGDVIGVAGTVNRTKKGYYDYTLELLSPVIYKLNGKEDLKILPPVNYLE